MRLLQLAMQLCTFVVVRDALRLLRYTGDTDRSDGTKRECNRGRVEAQFNLGSVKYTLLSMPSARCTIHLCGKWNYKRIPSCGIPGCGTHLAFTMSVHSIGLNVIHGN